MPSAPSSRPVNDRSPEPTRSYPWVSKHWWRDIFLNGLFFVLPFATVSFLAFQIWKLMRQKMYQLVDAFGISSDFRFWGAIVLAILVIAVASLTAGLLVQLGMISLGRRWLERKLLRLLPGYALMRMRLAENLGQKSPRTPALLRTLNGLQPVMIMSSNEQHMLIFMPNAPSASNGIILLVDPERVIPLEVGIVEFEDELHTLGVDLLQMIPPSVKHDFGA